MRWFAIRTFVRTKPSGLPKKRDRYFNPTIASIEERIVLFRARSGRTALKKGRAEAFRYARAFRHENMYGQKVVATLLPFAEAFELFDAPSDGVEVFSTIEVTNTSEDSRSALRRKIGKPSNSHTARMFISGSVAQELTERLGAW